MKAIALLSFWLLLAVPSAWADGGVGDISISALQQGLNTQSGSGWGPNGPGGTCQPSATVSCIDGPTVQALATKLVSAVLGEPVTDPTLLADIARLQGARSVENSTFLEFSIYFDSAFIYDFPPPAPGAKAIPIQTLDFPETLVLDISSNGTQGTVTLQKPELDWRETSLRLVPKSPALLFYAEAVEVNLLNSTISIEAGLWDALSIWETGSLTNFSLSVDWGRTLLANLNLFFLPLIFAGH